ncbi:MAG: hypothetical protein ACRDHL_03090 [Candidatus Promineifilaceae bacterium]
MQVQFFDEPGEGPRPRDEIRIRRLGLFLYEDLRRVAVGFELTPFLERPSLAVVVTNAHGEEAAALTIIEAMQPNFNLTLHLRDSAPTESYQVEAWLYYPQREPDGRQVVDYMTRPLDASRPGDQTEGA